MMKARKKLLFGILLAAVVVTLGGGLGGWLYINSLVYDTCRVEAGVTVTASDFLKTPNEEAYFTENSKPFDVTLPGEYQVIIKNGWLTHHCTLIVEDTIAPEGEPVSVTLEYGQTCEAADFVTNVTDATQVTVNFAEEPDFSVIGVQTVWLLLTDLGGNETVLCSELSIIQVMTEVTVEAGEEAPEIEDFVLFGEEITLLTDLNEIDYTQLGEHEILLEVDGYSYVVMLYVVDTTPPVVQVHDVEGYTLLPRTVDDFVTSVEDVTEVTVSFQEEPDLTLAGAQQLILLFIDEGGNVTEKEVTLSLTADTEPPVISGVQDIEIVAGDSISYKKGVTVKDNADPDPVLKIDNSSVNAATPGDYTVTYTATDFSGNSTTVEAKVTVDPKSTQNSEEEVYKMAQKILNKITDDSMDDMDVAFAIYWWVHKNISYTGPLDETDWVTAAHDGFIKRKGNCFTYYSVAKALFDVAGIENLCVARTDAGHYWNLINLGDGWYHVDCTPRKGSGDNFFMVTDKELEAYSAKHNNSHRFDSSLYPERATKSVQYMVNYSAGTLVR